MYKYKKVISAIVAFMILCSTPFVVNAQEQTEVDASVTTAGYEGYCFITNKKHNKVIQIDDNTKPDYSDESAILELWGYVGGNYQMWNIIHVEDEYYAILSAKSGKAISVQSGNLNTGNLALVVDTYTGAERQQWSFSQLSDGSVVIRPRTGAYYTNDWCMASGGGVLTSNGRNVEQRKFVADDDYSDHWIITYFPTTG